MDQTLKKAEFRLFTVIWNQLQDQQTPKLHLHMAQWLEYAYTAGDKNLLLMAFRSAGKSTLVGLFAAWLLYQNPNIRILVLAADHALAKKMVRNVKRIIERHPLTKPLKPKDIDQWAADRFTVTRDQELRDPSVLARGISANMTGSRADIVICDDVEVPNTCDSPQKREDLRERLAEIPYVLTAGGTQIYVGTPHDYYSIYADTPRTEIGEERCFLDGFKRLSIPLLDEQGKSVWPERYTPDTIAEFKASHGQNKFDSQMMLRAVNIKNARLDPEALHFYDASHEYDSFIHQMFIGSQRMMSVSAWWDPSFGSAHGDDSVLAIVFIGQDGDYYVHHLEYLKIDPNDDADEATQQCRIVAKLCKEHRIPRMNIEANGIGKFLPQILRKEMDKEGAQTHVNDKHSTKNKSARILEAFDTVLAARKLHIHKKICETPFIMQMREWQPGKSSCKDDALDAIAGALAAEPYRIEQIRPKGSYSWTQSGKTHKVKDDWNV